jgi:outer membrane protein
VPDLGKSLLAYSIIFFFLNMASSMNNKRLFVLILILLFGSFSFSFYLFHIRPRIAFVRSAELIYEYNGMRDARNEYKSQSDAWQANIDTLRMQYQRCLTEYQSSYKTLTNTEREEKQSLVKKLEDNLKNYTAVIQKQAQEKEKTITDGVLNQINSYVEQYAKKQGYDIVIGGANGSLIYGDKAFDITDEVLQVLNKQYQYMPSKLPASPESGQK